MFTLPFQRKDAFYIQFHLTEDVRRGTILYYSWATKGVKYYMNAWEAESRIIGIAEATV